MALTIAEFLRAVNPNIGLVVNPDGSYRIGVEDVNSDEILIAVNALNVALQAGGITQAQLAAILAAIQTGIILGAGTNVIGGVNPPTVVRVLHPFGKGLLTAGGVQYGALVSGIAQVYASIGTQIIYNPAGYTLVELELALMGQTQASGAVDSVIYEAQGSDAGALWDTLSSVITRAASAAALADFANVLSGRVNLAAGTNLLGTGTSFQIRVVIKSGGATNTVAGSMKNSSYVICTYRRT